MKAVNCHNLGLNLVWPRVVVLSVKKSNPQPPHLASSQFKQHIKQIIRIQLYTSLTKRNVKKIRMKGNWTSNIIGQADKNNSRPLYCGTKIIINVKPKSSEVFPKNC